MLTAQASEAHLEALSTIRTDDARSRSSTSSRSTSAICSSTRTRLVQGGELDTALLLHLAPELVRMELSQDFALTLDMMRKLPSWSEPASAARIARVGRLSQPGLAPEGGGRV